jgi:hypothetical protein
MPTSREKNITRNLGELARAGSAADRAKLTTAEQLRLSGDKFVFPWSDRIHPRKKMNSLNDKQPRGYFRGSLSTGA